MLTHEVEYDSDIFKTALGNLLIRKEYHIASPIEKQEMLMDECRRIFIELNK